MNTAPRRLGLKPGDTAEQIQRALQSLAQAARLERQFQQSVERRLYLQVGPQCLLRLLARRDVADGSGDPHGVVDVQRAEIDFGGKLTAILALGDELRAFTHQA